MKWRIVTAVTVVSVMMGLTATVVVMAIPWTDTQTASGTVTAQTTSELLYICEHLGTAPAGAPPACGADDSGPDEVIFEDDEALSPGGAPATWDIKIVNVSTGPWDVISVTTTATETLDPGADCVDLPTVEYISNGASFVDNHAEGSEPIPGSPVFFTQYLGTNSIVHVEPAERETMQVQVSLPASTQAECEGTAWDVTTEWTVQPHD